MDERAAIFGLETEYAILYLPDHPEDSSRPPFSKIQETIFSTLQKIRKTALSAGVKGGFFVQNGGLVHLEMFLRHPGDTPILEASTPECRTPKDLLVYSRAFDRLLTDICEASRGALDERGYRGTLAFGKSNLDQRGVGFGSHENYLVHHRSSRGERLVYFLFLPAILVLLLPALLMILAALVVVAMLFLAGRFIRPTQVLYGRTRRWFRKRDRIARQLLAAYHLGSSLLLYPCIALYRCVLRWTVLRPFVSHLTPFLVTRQVFAGSGRLNFDHGVFETSQRAGSTRSLSTIVVFGRGKTIFDLKSLLYEPLSFFRSTKRLVVTLGDSNLCDHPAYLKLAATALIIEMIESDERFEEIRLRRPLRALRQISREGPWKKVETRRGLSRSAMEIQREYLARARVFFARRPSAKVPYAEILDLWGQTLDALSERPQSLASRLDWVAKKSLLDGAILPATDWRTFFTWGRVFHLAGLPATGSASDLADMLRRAPLLRRRRVRRAILEHRLAEEDFDAQRGIHLRARKIDLRYHEIGAPGGYQRTLEAQGLIRRLTTDEEVDHATREPPADTRARIRGYYIQLSSAPEAIHVSWNEIDLHSRNRHIPTPDPFFHDLPGDGP
ncbi:MAG: proteasome accessory factor PafA2 family protein [Planctomycetes bacterium]|nr:proteasome accessory factor PafA2 family protein [Planctomycetota bacterium]